MDGFIENSQYLFRNISITISFLLILTYASSRVGFPKMFAVVYDFSKFLNFKIKDEFGSNIRLFSAENLYFTAILSASTSFVILNLFIFNNEVPAHFSWLVPKTFLSGLLIWLLMTIVIQLVFLIKYFFIVLIGFLFNLPSNVSRHYHEVQSLNNCFVLGLMTICSLAVYSRFSFPVNMVDTMVMVLLIYLLYRLLNIYVKLEQLKVYSKLYIFSYLCTTEIIPTILGIELLS